VIQSKESIQKQLDEAYRALNNLKDRKAEGGAGRPPESRSARVLQTHIRYLKQLLKEES
jgi:hypothetical protein